MSSDDEAELRRAAIVLRDLCASTASSNWRRQNHDLELEHEGVDADEVYPGVFIGTAGLETSHGSRFCALFKFTQLQFTQIRGEIQ